MEWLMERGDDCCARKAVLQLLESFTATFVVHPHEEGTSIRNFSSELTEANITRMTTKPVSKDSDRSHPRKSSLFQTFGKDLDVLLDYLRPVYEKEVEPGLDSHNRGVTKFEHIWLLFSPGSTVFAKVKGLLMFFKVLRAKKKKSKEGTDLRQWTITVWGLDFDGYQLKRHSRSFDIEAYTEERDIRKLPVIPVRFLDCDQAKLISRGKMYYEFMCDAPLYRRYEGPVNGDERDKYFGDVVIDPLGYMHESPQAKKLSPGVRQVLSRGQRSKMDEFGMTYDEPTDLGGGPLYSKFNDMVCSKETHLEDDQYLLLPGYVQGYALGRKEWMAFELESFPEPKENSNPWDYLVMNEKDRQLVQSLAPGPLEHLAQEWTTDFIAGKGQGQVVLLHGPPGVGKTFTVECLAKQLDRPLLSLTVANIGTEETVVERKLSKWLTLAAKWNAIVLIDEAETYMSPRANAELSRHALITAFLRSLEYYPGLIILTTNTPGQIDDAFLSRIHVAIEYAPLTNDQREAIWLGFIGQLERKCKDIKIDRTSQKFVQNYANDPDRPLNGRDIRNAFQAAVRLAIQEASHNRVTDTTKEPILVTFKHFKQVLENKMALKSNKDSITGMTEGQRAHEGGARGPAKVRDFNRTSVD